MFSRGGLDIKYLWFALDPTSLNQGALDLYCSHASTLTPHLKLTIPVEYSYCSETPAAFPITKANCLAMHATSHILSPVIPSITFTTQTPLPAPFSPLAANGLLPSSPIPEVPTFLPAVCAKRDLGFALRDPFSFHPSYAATARVNFNQSNKKGGKLTSQTASPSTRSTSACTDS